VASLQAQFDVNVLGILRMGRAFAPILARNGGGAMLNVLSVASWINRGALGLYGTSKSAAWGLTNSLRNELRPQGTRVLAMHVGFVDTDLTRDIDAPKSSATVVVGRALDALEAGQEEVLADEITQQVKRGLSADAPVYLAAA
jgi:NAD(P)-dependent dehydrogenase (short-subunit alcohol dehydrogenase family)